MMSHFETLISDGAGGGPPPQTSIPGEVVNFGWGQLFFNLRLLHYSYKKIEESGFASGSDTRPQAAPTLCNARPSSIRTATALNLPMFQPAWNSKPPGERKPNLSFCPPVKRSSRLCYNGFPYRYLGIYGDARDSAGRVSPTSVRDCESLSSRQPRFSFIRLTWINQLPLTEYRGMNQVWCCQRLQTMPYRSPSGQKKTAGRPLAAQSDVLLMQGCFSAGR